MRALWVVLAGPVDGLAFEVYVREVLGPKVAAIEGALAAQGAQLHFLPTCSPDLNPIEQCWAKIKTALRPAKARTFEVLLAALKTALQSITPKDAIAWFGHCR